MIFQRKGLAIAAFVLVAGLFFGSAPASGQKITKENINGREALVLPPTPDSPIPPGTVIAFAGGIVPKGWLLCDGSFVKINPASSRLVASLGKAFGGDGARDIRIPDLRGRTVVGLTNMGQQPPTDIIPDPRAQKLGEGGTFGSAQHKLSINEMPKHQHDGSAITGDGAHRHFIACAAQINRGKPGAEFSLSPETPPCQPQLTGQNAPGEDGKHSHGLDLKPQGGDAPFSIIPPSIVLNYLIKY